MFPHARVSSAGELSALILTMRGRPSRIECLAPVAVEVGTLSRQNLFVGTLRLMEPIWRKLFPIFRRLALQKHIRVRQTTPESSSAVLRISLLPKVAKRCAQRKNMALRGDAASALRASSWSDWEPGQFRRKSREPRRPLISLHGAEANSMMQVDVGVPLSPTELKRRAQLAKEWCSDTNQYTVLPEIVHQNFQHSLKKLDNELSLRRGGRVGVERYTSLSNQEGRWDQIRQISRMEHVPVKELFATPRRRQRCDTRYMPLFHLLAKIHPLLMCSRFVNAC